MIMRLYVMFSAMLLTAFASFAQMVPIGAGMGNFSTAEASFLKTEGLAVTSGGCAYVSLYAEFPENGASGVVVCAAEGKVWGDVSYVVSGASHGVLWLNPMGALCLFYTSGDVIYCTMCMNPDASSPTWNAPVEVGQGYASGPPVVSGRSVILPAMLSGQGPGVFVSQNNGMSWEWHDGPSDTPELQKAAENNPKLYISASGEISMVSRSLGTASAWRSVSGDGGMTWSRSRKFIYNPATDLSVVSIGGGLTAVAKNCRYDNKVYHQKKGLYVYLTPNDGDLWYGGIRIDGREGVSDPVMTYSGGRLHVVYTYEEKGINEILYSSMTVREVEQAWGTLSTVPSFCCRIFSAGRSQEAFDRKLNALNLSSRNWADKPLRAATYNIINHRLVKTPTWEQRLGVLKKMWEEYDFDIVGSQEPDTMQIRTLVETLGDDFAWTGTVMENPQPEQRGAVIAVNPIFYRKSRLEVLEKGVIPFSDAVGVRGFDAAGYGRNCNWAKFRDKETGKVFFLFNSHVDHRGLEAKEYSSVVLLEAAAQLSQGLPCLFTGDFNLNETNPGYEKMVTSGWTDDTMLALPEKKRENWEYFSMAKFKPLSTVAKSYRHIDHIFYTPSSSKVMSWKLITDSYDGIYGSDHLPIVIDWLIAN